MNNIEATAGELLKMIAKQNNCKNNREIHKKLGFSYEVTNRYLREDKELSDNFLNKFFNVFKVNLDTQYEIRLKKALASADPILREAYFKLQKENRIQEENKNKSRAQQIMQEAFEYAIKKGIIDEFIKLDNEYNEN